MVDADDFLDQPDDASISDSVDFSLATGVNWTTFGESVVGSIIAAIAIGYTALIQGWSSALDTMLGGLGSFSGELIRTVGASPTNLISGAWSFTVDQYGLLALPIGAGTVIIAFWIVSQAAEYIRRYIGV